MRSPIGAIVVVVPVHDEAELLGRCLAALERAVSETSMPCVVRVVLDACTDESGVIAAQHPFPVLQIDANAVGAARAHGVDAALTALRGFERLPPDRIWIANTDADSVVPADWLIHQRVLADDGADVTLGTVRPDFDDLTDQHRRHWLATHPRGRPTGNTHGANLGVRASTYLSVGGFEPVELDEDVRLVDACREDGAMIAVSDTAEVMTSGRVDGRAPGGYADFVRELADRFASDDSAYERDRKIS